VGRSTITRGRPRRFPLARAVSRPARTRSEMRIRSCLDTVAITAITASRKTPHSREFRTVTGGVLHASGGAQNNVMEFTFNKVASRTYRVELGNLSVGEYGFLAPGTTASLNAASQGKVYTFRIAD
jgi:hypothetical protein